MTRQNNPRFKVVFLVDLVFFLSSTIKLPAVNNQANRPSSQNQNRQLPTCFDRIEAPLRSNEDNQENQSQTPATSLPTEKSIDTFPYTNSQITPFTKSKLENHGKQDPTIFHTSSRFLTVLFFGISSVLLVKGKGQSNLKKIRPISDQTLGLVAQYFKSTMEKAMIFIDDNRTNTIGTFVPSDSAAI